MRTQEIVIVGHPGALGMELCGARDIFDLANTWLAEQGREPAYRLRVASLDGGPLTLWGGLMLAGTEALRDYAGPIDTLVLVGGPEAGRASEDADLVAAVRRVAGRSRRVAALCTGAYIAAAAGLLDGKRATTHWMFGDDLAGRHPHLVVDTAPIYVNEGGTWTSAGITASFDLVLSLVEDDLGSEAARALARILVMFLRRTGNQDQFSVQLSQQEALRHPVRELQQYIADHPEADLSLTSLAARVHMSPRHFTRVFCAEVGLSPGRYVERARLETARRRLEESDLPIDVIAATSGFGSTESMRRIFLQNLSISPAEYRRRFGRLSGATEQKETDADCRTGPRHHRPQQQDLRRAAGRR